MFCRIPLLNCKAEMCRDRGESLLLLLHIPWEEASSTAGRHSTGRVLRPSHPCQVRCSHSCFSPASSRSWEFLWLVAVLQLRGSVLRLHFPLCVVPCASGASPDPVEPPAVGRASRGRAAAPGSCAPPTAKCRSYQLCKS